MSNQRVASIICNRLTDLLEDYLSGDIGEDILAECPDGFIIEQVATDIEAGLKAWAASDATGHEALVSLVTECADEYLDDLDDPNDERTGSND